MRTFDARTKARIQETIDEHLDGLQAIDGFVDAEPGFPVVDGRVLKEPAILVFVLRKRPVDEVLLKDRVPRQLGEYPVHVMQAGLERQVAHLDAMHPARLALEVRHTALTYAPMPANPIDKPVKVKVALTCHVGPDAGWPVLKPFLEGAEHKLTAAMYDLNADYIAKTLIDVVHDGSVEMTLTWDDGMTPQETAIRKKLKSEMGNQLDGWIVRCGANKRFPNAYHEKVVVRDHAAFWLSSGNWSLRSQPNIDPIARPEDAPGMYSKGNREWHVIVPDEALSALFEEYILYDKAGCQAELAQGHGGAALSVEVGRVAPEVLVPIDTLYSDLALAVPKPVAPRQLPSQPRDIDIQPVLSPDNYVDRITALLKEARKSLYVQYAYITYSDAAQDQKFRDMLQVLATASYKPAMDVRIIVGSSSAADKIRKLVQAGFNPACIRVQGNLHNKGIVVDGKTVLVSSANWSSDGVLRNRDAGLIIRDAEIAGYYQAVFIDDWDHRARSQIPEPVAAVLAVEGQPTPPGMVRMSWADYYG